MTAIFYTEESAQRIIDIINEGIYIGMKPMPLFDGTFGVPIDPYYEDYFSGAKIVTQRQLKALLIVPPYIPLNYSEYGTVTYTLFSDQNVIVEDGKLFQWKDTTGGTLFCDQIDSGKRPIYGYGALNGYPVIKFVKENSSYLTFLEKIPKPANWTVFLVFRIPDNTIRQGFCGASDVPGNGNRMWGAIFNKDIGSDGQLQADGSITSVNSNDVIGSCTTTDPSKTIIDNEWIVVCVSYKDGDGFQRIYADGIIQATITDPSDCTTNYGVTREYTIGRPGGYNGIYCEMETVATIMYSSALTDANILLISNNLISKYKIL